MSLCHEQPECHTLFNDRLGVFTCVCVITPIPTCLPLRATKPTADAYCYYGLTFQKCLWGHNKKEKKRPVVVRLITFCVFLC